MAFKQVAAPTGLQTGGILSADNSIPERHIVVETVRNAAPRLGLSASVISTLDAMLSCLAPKRTHHTVFASNATLTFRRNGISDRTIRRHAAKLQELGLLVRHDSPNGKRFTKHNGTEGKTLRFGFDLSPLFDRLQEMAAMAAEVLREKEQIDYLRTKIRAAANASLAKNPNNYKVLNIFRDLRRKLSLSDCNQILSELSITNIEAESAADQPRNETATLAASDGQYVRHHHSSIKEHIDKERRPLKKQTKPKTEAAPITVQELLSACPEAALFSPGSIDTMNDVVSHARTLAPMLGITSQSYEAACERIGPIGAAATVWAIMQFQSKIKSVGAYFRSITTGSKSDDFSPEKLVRRLVVTQNYTA